MLAHDAPGPVRELAQEFIEVVERSTGARLPLLTDTGEPEAPSGASRLYLGACAQTGALGSDAAEPPEETYRRIVRGRHVYILGRPAEEILRPGRTVDPWYDSDPMRWALNHLLEEELGVRWLWPGRLGTYVPRHRDFSVPASDRTYRPLLEIRTLVVATMREPAERTLRAEALRWVSNHQGGERGGIPLRHGFNQWWEKYHASHPDYFARPPEGVAQRPPTRVKLRLANPAVLEQIAQEYLAAGKPRYWNVTPNDGNGFDVSDDVRAWDLPAGQPVEEIWTAKANLTARYVRFWNLVYERLAKENSEIRLVTMAYSAYRQPPPPGRPLKAKALIGVVPSYRAYDVWDGWAQQAEALILRPNWGWYGANGPHLPLVEMADYMKHAFRNKMIGFYLDSILGYWGTQGLNYYLLARLMVNPERSVDEIVTEYTAAFGAAAPKIKEYFDYWQKLTREWAHGHKIYKVPEGKYDALIREGKIMDNPLIGPRQAIPYIYTDEVLAKAYTLLDEGQALLEGGNDPEALARIDFLRKGLDELKLSRECLELGRRITAKNRRELIGPFKRKAGELEALRTALSPSHVIWGIRATRIEDKVKIKIRPRNLSVPVSPGEDDF
ncbi:MAG TPA: DUF4838 domain-containing protein [Chthoniobacteraceae bacterium]|nr:DUF4838 domain-containing protein [Chthoniobacteraceae bacterium]